MSASLVGSEMCIRDSPLGTEHRRRRRGGTNPGAFYHVDRGRLLSQFRLACLLYTSDAADDM
eukprot:13129637-Alexandrium_andersonii.AAC.1